MNGRSCPILYSIYIYYEVKALLRMKMMTKVIEEEYSEKRGEKAKKKECVGVVVT